MHGSLAIAKGVLYVGRCAKTAWISTFDVDGQRLEGGFEFRDEDVGRSSASGLAVDEDHRVWVADGAGGRVRAFTLFGRPLVDVSDDRATSHDESGLLGRPVDVSVRGCDDDLEVVVASGGVRRHALQIFHPATGRVNSLRPEAGPRGFFHDLCGVSWVGERLYVCEGGAGAVRVYQDGALHWSLSLPVAGGGLFRPTGVAVLRDGGMVVSCGDRTASALLYCEADGRIRRVLAQGGVGEGEVDEPLDVVVDEDAEGGPRAIVIDRAGDRVQVFTLEGRCYGAFPQLTGT